MDLPEIPVEISEHYEHDYDESQRLKPGVTARSGVQWNPPRS